MGKVSNGGTALIPEVPASAAFQNSATPVPIGEITPRPVMTTRFSMRLPLARALFDLRPRVAQSDRTIEPQAGGRRVARIDAEVAVALELEARAPVDAGQRRLEPSPAYDLERLRVEHGLPVVRIVRPGRAEEVLVQADLGGGDRVRRGHPVDGPPHPAPAGVAAARVGVVGAAYLHHLPGAVPLDARALDDVGVAQPNLGAGREPEVLGRRRVAEVVLLDVEDTRERHLAASGRRVLRVVDRFHLLDL